MAVAHTWSVWIHRHTDGKYSIQSEGKLPWEPAEECINSIDDLSKVLTLLKSFLQESALVNIK